MIKIERGEVPENTALDNKKEEKLQEIRDLINSGKPADFKGRELWSSAEVKEFLYESQHGKCCYCERRLPRGETDVEHFRPKGKVKEAEKDHPGYWWLAYNWQNLLISCQLCNRTYKRAQFPLKDESKRVYEEGCGLDEEEPFLINPLEEDPEQCIYYEELKEDQFMVKAVGTCERARRTVKELTGINDAYVMLERANKLKDYRGWAYLKNNGDDESIRSEAEEHLQEYVSPRSEFSGFARFYLSKEGYL